MSIADLPLTYEKQIDFRMCGAAALCMVYRAFGKPASQDDVWERVSRKDMWGQLAGWTHLLCQDALRRGFGAVVMEVRSPAYFLDRFDPKAYRVILNHRPNKTSDHGHYTVLVSVSPRDVLVHDPQFGPVRRLARDELLDLWKPNSPASEITGNILVAVSNKPFAPTTCDACGTEIPETVACPRCSATIRLAPAGSLGCVKSDCGERKWKRLFCPECDLGLRRLPSPDTTVIPLHDADEATDEPKKRTPLEGLELFCQEMESAAHLAPSEIKSAILDTVSQMRDLMAKLPGMLEKEVQETTEALVMAKRKIDEIEAKLQEPFTPPQPTPKPPPADPRQAVDLSLGGKLRRELLDWLGVDATPTTAPPSIDDDWPDWSDFLAE